MSVMIEALPFADDPILMAAWRFWNDVAVQDGVADVGRLDPLLMPPEIVRYVVLSEYRSPDGDMYFRLVGEEMAERWGENFAGKTSDELFSGEYLTFINSAFALAYETRKPVYAESAFRWDNGGWSRTMRLMFPFVADKTSPPVRCLVIQTWPGGEQPVEQQKIIPIGSTVSEMKNSLKSVG